MVRDKHVKTTRNMTFYAVKVQKSAEHYTEAAMDEVELLNCVAKERNKVKTQFEKSPASKDKDGVIVSAIWDHSKHVATLHDSFFHTGPNGRHMCMVFSMLGCNLLSVIKAYNYRGIPIPVVKKMIKGVAKGLDFLHRKCKIIHTDLKPENVLLQFQTQINDENNDNDRSDLEVDNTVQLASASTVEINYSKSHRMKGNHHQKDLDPEFNNNVNQNHRSGDVTPQNSHELVLSRLSHSAFVMKNFSDIISDNNISNVADNSVKVSRPSKSEISSHFQICGMHGGSGSGIAEVSFILRAFVPEGEIADIISEALNGIPWEKGEDDDGSREW